MKNPADKTVSFASDNYAGIHPEVLAAIMEANIGHASAYGGDAWTEKFQQVIKKEFGENANAAIVFNGTAANVLSLGAMNKSYQSIFCSEAAHIQEDECGAPERFTGSKLLTVPHQNGKITVEGVKAHLKGVGSQHQVQPGTISISQSTEFGTVYSSQEVRTLSEFAHANGMLLHMDGARIANAAVSLGLGLRQSTVDLGVDVLSLGGTKNGLMGAEAVIFFKPGLSEGFSFLRKQGMQLASKMRFVSAQLVALFEGDLWSRNASWSNQMAQRLAEGAGRLEGVKISRPVQANGVFALLPSGVAEALQKEFFFHIWNDRTGEVRWMTAFDTREEDVDLFLKSLERLLKKR